MRFALVTLGCDKNTVDSERYLASLVEHGATATDDLGDAEIIVVNTCGFIDAAKRESIDAIVNAGSFKASGVCQAVVAVGCMVERHKGELARALPEVDIFLGASQGDQLVPQLIERGLLSSEILAHPGERLYAGTLPHVRYLKVSEGCDHGCAFCAIPLMRGKHRSFGLDDIVREAQLLEVQGAREVNLVAQDLAHYGRDRRDGVGLPELLSTLVRETSIPWFRNLYLYSAGITPALLEVIAREPRIVRYLDMPMQHGSDRMLTAMRRPERKKTIREHITRFREAVPELAIRTTVIVGFPGETDDDVDQLCDLLEELRLERVGVFTYSEQEGTHGAKLADDVPEFLKLERQERVSELQRSITADRYEERVGARATALVDYAAADGNAALARLPWQADDIDGMTRLEAGAGFAGVEPAPGDLVEVEVAEVVDDYDFVARVLRVVPRPAAPVARRGLPVMASAAPFASYGK
jgi:ribosomal protein S12 methylthiotransferase